MTEEVSYDVDALGFAFGNALELYGDQGYWVMSVNDFGTLSGKSDITEEEVKYAVSKKSKELGKSLVFTVTSGMHADLGDSYWVSWWPGGVVDA